MYNIYSVLWQLSFILWRGLINQSPSCTGYRVHSTLLGECMGQFKSNENIYIMYFIVCKHPWILYLHVNSNDIPHGNTEYRSMNHHHKQNTVGKFYNHKWRKGDEWGGGTTLEECTSAQKQELVWNYLRIEFLFISILFLVTS